MVLESIRQLAKGFSNTPIICAVVSPFMLAGQLRGNQDAIMDVIRDPKFMKVILERATEWDLAYSSAAMDAGADVIAMIDATSSGDILSPQQYAEFALPHQKKVVDAIHKAGGHTILHICGDTTDNMPYMMRTGAKASRRAPVAGVHLLLGAPVRLYTIAAAARVWPVANMTIPLRSG